MEALDAVGGDAAANAILTTDLVDKQVALELDLQGRLVRIGGMAKGSGMIHPDMATMLGFFSCDVGVDAGVWQGMVRRAVQRSFNAITVDGDTSTNDTVLAFAAGPPLAEAPCRSGTGPHPGDAAPRPGDCSGWRGCHLLD